MQDISMEKAIECLLAQVPEMRESEEISLIEALGRVSADTVTAPFDNPPFDRSPLDGYALRSEDTASASKEHPVVLDVIGEECAGDFFEGTVGSGQALRIMTGAAMPDGTDAVIRQEVVLAEGNRVEIHYPLKHHENYCFAGEDISSGSVLIEKGTTLEAAHIGVLASMGFTSAHVYKKPCIALASTGDELLMPGDELRPGKIYNSNLYLLEARLRELGHNIKVTGILPDDPVKAAARIREHIETVDLFITTGCVSVGKKDIMHEVVKLLEAQRLFWRVKMKPGAPAIGYRAGDMLGIALSGNPFAAYATFELLTRPVLRKLEGCTRVLPKRRKAVLEDAFPKESRGRRFIRAFLDDGRVRLPEQHASGSLFSAAGCNAFVDVAAGTGKLEPGMEVEVVLM